MTSVTTDNEPADGIGGNHEPPVRDVTGQSWAWTEQRYHRLILFIACLVLGASFLLRIEGSTRVVVPGSNLPLPSTCMFRNVTGMDCPGCGLTRSFVCLAHGRWPEAWHYHPLGWVLFGVALAQIPLRIVQLRRLQRGRPAIVLPGVAAFTWGLMLLMLGQWIVRGIAGKW